MAHSKKYIYILHFANINVQNTFKYFILFRFIPYHTVYSFHFYHFFYQSLKSTKSTSDFNFWQLQNTFVFCTMGYEKYKIIIMYFVLWFMTNAKYLYTLYLYNDKYNVLMYFAFWYWWNTNLPTHCSLVMPSIINVLQFTTCQHHKLMHKVLEPHEQHLHTPYHRQTECQHIYV